MKYFLILIALMLVGVYWIDKTTEPATKSSHDADIGIAHDGDSDRGKTPKPVKELTPEEKALRNSLAGEYEYNFTGTIAKQRLIFQKNGKVELSRTFGKTTEAKWSIVDGEIQIHPSQWESGGIDVYRINTDDHNATKPITSITQFARIIDGKRRDSDRERTHKKIK